MMDAELVVDMNTAGPALPEANEIAAALAGMRAVLEAMRAETVAALEAVRADNAAMRDELARLRAALGLPADGAAPALKFYERVVVDALHTLGPDEHNTQAISLQAGYSDRRVREILLQLARRGIVYRVNRSQWRLTASGVA